jgi:hypothetical protein
MPKQTEGEWENAHTFQRRGIQGAGDEEIGFFCHTDHGVSGNAGGAMPSAPRRQAAHQSEERQSGQ